MPGGRPPIDVSPYIEIVETGLSATGKTKVFEVRNASRNDDIPGIIRWHGAWRGYVYECEDSFYDAKCLRQIATFIEQANQEHGK